MKRWLGGTEIDLVRYLVAHEQAHIKYSSPTYINTWEGYPVHNIVSQACEDIRIEAKAMQEFVGNNETIRRGRKIAIDKWEQTFDPENLLHCLVQVIYGGHIQPKYRDANSNERYLQGAPLLKYVLQAVAPYFEKIDSIPDWAKTTEDMDMLIRKIAADLEHLQTTSGKSGQGEGEGEGQGQGQGQGQGEGQGGQGDQG